MDQIRSLVDRPRLYNNIDGVGELGCSLMLLGYSLLFLLLMRSPEDSVWHRSSFFFFLGLMLLIHFGTKAVKTRITYPRTGFVEYRKQRRTVVMAAVVGAALTPLLALALRRQSDISLLLTLCGVALALGYGYNLAREVRWKWFIVGAMAAASIAIAFLPTDILSGVGSEFPAHPNRAKFLGTILLSLLD